MCTDLTAEGNWHYQRQVRRICVLGDIIKLRPLAKTKSAHCPYKTRETSLCAEFLLERRLCLRRVLYDGVATWWAFSTSSNCYYDWRTRSSVSLKACCNSALRGFSSSSWSVISSSGRTPQDVMPCCYYPWMRRMIGNSTVHCFFRFTHMFIKRLCLLNFLGFRHQFCGNQSQERII